MIERVTIEGLDELQTALRKLPDATAKNVVRRILRARAQPIADRAEQLAPEDQGDLKDSIAVSTRLSKRQKRMHRKVDPHDIEVYVGPGPLPQAHLQEFGTQNHQAKPFMRPAWDAEKNKVLHNLRVDLWNEIQKAAARLARKASKGR